MADKVVLMGEITKILNRAVGAFENGSGEEIGQISRSTSIRICIMIDEPTDIDWGIFHDEVIDPILNQFRELNWVATTSCKPGIGLWIELS